MISKDAKRVFKTPSLDCTEAFSPTTGKYRPEKTPDLDTFHAVLLLKGRLFAKTFFALPR